MTYNQAIDFMYAALPMFHREGKPAFKKGLGNTEALCAALGNPEKSLKCVHIAGTNGKGSTAHSIAAVLQQAGYKTGLYTSPHLKSFTERIRVDGKPIDEDTVTIFIEDNMELLETVKPSFFEMTVALAFDYFASQEVDIAIIETGLGGRFDSTNVITPLVSVITNISYDHMDMLGNTLEEIAFEKAGIIKPGVPVVLSEIQPDTLPVFLKKTIETASPLILAEVNWLILNATTDHGVRYVDVYRAMNPSMLRVRCQLAGSYQTKNLPGILQTLAELKKYGFKITKKAVRSGLANVSTLTGLKGRWQVIGHHPLIICDTAHNEAGIAEVTKQLARLRYNRLHMVFGTVKDKDPVKVLRKLPRNAQYYFCKPDIPRGLDEESLKFTASGLGLMGETWPSVAEAIVAAKKQAGKDDIIFIGGSNFVVAEADI
ncbi:MAG: folylpolyglutamate synthase/dihydrofolate synthase family protein [Bacteroidota bacterium]